MRQVHVHVCGLWLPPSKSALATHSCNKARPVFLQINLAAKARLGCKRESEILALAGDPLLGHHGTHSCSPGYPSYLNFQSTQEAEATCRLEQPGQPQSSGNLRVRWGAVRSQTSHNSANGLSRMLSSARCVKCHASDMLVALQLGQVMETCEAN